MNHRFLFSLFSILSVVSIHATVYVKPSIAPTFRVDTITLDVDRIKRISNSLTILSARQHDPMDAKALQLNAKLLSLAMQLNPQNKIASAVNEAYARADHTSFAASKLVIDSFESLLHYSRFLETQRNYKSNLDLALLIKDCLFEINKTDKSLVRHEVDPKRWSNIPAIQEYQKPGIRPLPEEGDEKPVAGDDEKTPPHVDNNPVKDLLVSFNYFDASTNLADNNNARPSRNEHTEQAMVAGVQAVKLNKGSVIEYDDHAPIKADKTFTTSIWLNATTNEARGSIVGQIDSKADNHGWDIYLREGIIFVQLINKQPNDSLIVATIAEITAGQWTNVTVSYNGSKRASGIQIYINGKEAQTKVYSDTLTGDITSKVKLSVGQRAHGVADLSEVAISNIVISRKIKTVEEIKAHVSKYIKLDDNDSSDDKPNPEVKKDPVENTGVLTLRRKEGSILSPMIQAEEVEERWVYHTVLATILVNNKGTHDDPSLKLFMAPAVEREDTVENIARAVNQSINDSIGKLDNAMVSITTARHVARSNIYSLSGPIAIALAANALDKDIPEGTTVCGYARRGELIRPKSLWYQLPALVKSTKPHRVIIGKGASLDFKQLLVMKNIGFFILNEVIEVSTLKQGVDVATRSNADIEQACNIFAQLRKQYDEEDIGRMAFDAGVRRQLEQILKIYPNHISAQMILLWGDNNRPKTFDSKYSLIILNDTLKKFERLKERDFVDLNHRSLPRTAKEVSSKLEEIKDYIGDEEDLFEKIEECVPLLESIGRNKEQRPRSAEVSFGKLKQNIVGARALANKYFKVKTPKKPQLDKDN